MGKKKRKETPAEDEAKGSFHSPFAGLEGLRNALPEGEFPAPQVVDERADAGDGAKAPARAVIRYRRKGRGGKEVTLVEKLGLSPDDLLAWLKALKQELGCGGAVEGDVIALQGDQRNRLPALLERRGVGRVSIS